MEKEVLFETKRNEEVGRYIVANADLNPGDVILEENPFAFGPKTESPPICLGCLGWVDCTVKCSSCGWPVCNSDCEAIPAHKEAECVVFTKARVAFQDVEDLSQPSPQYECITPLRVLLAKNKNPERWKEEVEVMETHAGTRKSQPIWHFNQVNVVEYLRGPCKLLEFDEDLIHTVCGILDVNTFEAHTISGNSIRCLYPKLGISAHNCISNITHSICNTGTGDGEDFRVTVRASTKISKGSELYSSYTYTLWPTLLRRAFLKESKYFYCRCQRCSDPTELGTHMSSLKCTKCDNGVIMSSAPLDPEAEWKCTHCANTIRGSTTMRIFTAIQGDMDRVDSMEQDASAIEAREQLFRSYRSVLHPRNAFLTMLRVSLAQMYGKVEGYTMDLLPDVLYERKIELCQHILENINIIEPGYTRLRGLILYELHAPIVMLSRNLYNSGCIDKKDLKEKLLKAVKLLEESATILSMEPENTNEGRLGSVAKQSCEQLKENLDTLIENA